MKTDKGSKELDQAGDRAHTYLECKTTGPSNLGTSTDTTRKDWNKTLKEKGLK